MLSFNPLFQRDFSPAWAGWRRHGNSAESGPRADSAQSTQVAADNVQTVLSAAYQKIQVTVQSRFEPVNAGTDAAPAQPDAQDFSPQAVADRILGFITDRLAQAKADGASDEKIQSLYQQALKGVEQGLREGKNIIQSQNAFSGDVKDNFYSTVNLLADGLQALGEKLFGQSLDQGAATDSGTAVDAGAGTVPAAGDAASTDTSSGTSSTNGGTAVSGSGFNAGLTQIQADSSRSFQLEVVTNEGDKVKIQVQSGQSLSAQQVSYNDANTSVSGFSASLSRYNSFSFSVVGDLNANELASLNDLFSQVNDVAATFYSGDVQQAFDQELQVGADPEQLASFAVNINQSQSVAVRNTYVAVQNQDGQAAPNPFQDLYQQLGNFADQLKQAGADLAGQDGAPANTKSLLSDLVGRLHSDHGKHNGNGHAFQRFANRVLS